MNHRYYLTRYARLFWGLITIYLLRDRGKRVKEELLELIENIEVIRGEFSISGGIGFPKTNSIYDKEKFLEWKQELRFELQEIYDRTKDKFIWSVLVLLKQKFNGWTDESSFNELVGSLKTIEKNIDKYYLDNIDSSTTKKYTTQKLLHLATRFIEENSGGKKPITLQSVRKSLQIGLNLMRYNFC